MNFTASSSSVPTVISLVNAGVISQYEARERLALEPIAGSNSKYEYWFNQPGWVTNPNINPITVPVPNGFPAWQNAPVIYPTPALPAPYLPVSPSLPGTSVTFEDIEAKLEAAGIAHLAVLCQNVMKAKPEESKEEPVEIEVLPLDRKRRIRLA